MKNRYITTYQAAEYLGVTDRTIRNMVTDGRLKAYKLGYKIYRLRLDEIEAAMKPVDGNGAA
jgi:excisionase family DNA binding protein